MFRWGNKQPGGSSGAGAGAGAGAGDEKVKEKKVTVQVIRAVLTAYNVQHVSNVDKASGLKKLTQIIGITEEEIVDCLQVRVRFLNEVIH